MKMILPIEIWRKIVYKCDTEALAALRCSVSVTFAIAVPEGADGRKAKAVTGL
jgi:hypothetical protein